MNIATDTYRRTRIKKIEKRVPLEMSAAHRSFLPNLWEDTVMEACALPITLNWLT